MQKYNKLLTGKKEKITYQFCSQNMFFFSFLIMRNHTYNIVSRYSHFLRRRVSSVVEHSSANPKVPGSIPGPVSYRGHGL